MKHILGLDLGTNSIGWALVSTDENGIPTQEIQLGSRIIPMSQDMMGDFDKGKSVSATKERTTKRSARRLRQRELLRSERLFRVLHTLQFLPPHFDAAIGWNRNDTAHFGKFLNDSEPKIAWTHDAMGKPQFFFMEAFNEMLADFQSHQPELVANGKRIPMDWTLYYLRKKALSQPLSKEELAWVLLSFNQKRGYYQLRGEGEEEAENNKKEEYLKITVADVVETGEKQRSNTEYLITFNDGTNFKKASKHPLFDWKGKEKEFVRTTTYDKEGNEKHSFRAPQEDDWALLKTRTESLIGNSGTTVGTYIYDTLLATPYEKIRGKLVRTIERRFYKEELQQILEAQTAFHPQFTDPDILEACLQELYPHNTGHQESLRRQNLAYLLLHDLIFYQRPLKSKKSLIANCPYEARYYNDPNNINQATGEVEPKAVPLKCIAKSNPYYQEFRLWQFIRNLRIIDRESDEDVTHLYLADTDKRAELFTFLNNIDKITEKSIIGDFLQQKKHKGKDGNYPLTWNYPADKEHPGNETRAAMLKAFKKAGMDSTLIDRRDEEYRLWHLLYSIDDKEELQGALRKYAQQHQLPDSFATVFGKIQPFKKEYGAYSEKAIKKLLTVMREGKYWNEEDVPQEVAQIINKTIDEHLLTQISYNGRELTRRNQFQGMNTWEACLAIYGRQPTRIDRWQSPDELAEYIRTFKQHSLRNPVVEQVLLETLRTVHDLWVKYGHIDEIHVELGRNMKQTAKQREADTKRIAENENTNMRIKLLLQEMKNDYAEVRPYSPMQQSILKIYEEGALSSLRKDDKDFNDIVKIAHTGQPTSAELKRYKLWLEQKYRSPYTGRTISLSQLFTTAYEIEHVIPQSRYFDDSFSNKVICEAEVNKEKGNRLGMEFINQCHGQPIRTVAHGDVKILAPEAYQELVGDMYYSNPTKKRKLLMEEIPAEFIQRQMNDSRYISRTVMGLLSAVVREEGELEANSKHVIPCTGGITDRLKQDWGLNDVWNTLVAPRFERMNSITDSSDYGRWEDKQGHRVFQTSLPIELQRGFSKKRIDHRHHAMDALVIALASRSIVQYLNTQSATDPAERETQRRQFCDKNREIRKPWPTFTQDAQKALEDIVVTFKSHTRVINKATNYYEHYDAKGKKSLEKQKGDDLWAVRKPLHKDTYFGRVELRRKKMVKFKEALEKHNDIANRDLRIALQAMKQEGMNDKKIIKQFKEQQYLFNGISVEKVEIFYFETMSAVRKPLDSSFNKEKILTISDTGIQQILLNYLAACNDDPEVAFSPEGIERLNRNIATYNNGHDHKPILKVRITEVMGMKHPVGYKGNRSAKYVEAAKGTNLYYAIYQAEDGTRDYATIPLSEVAERLKQGLMPCPEKNEKEIPLLFHLSPNDLVYVPTDDELQEDHISIEDLNKKRIYKFVSASGKQSCFIPFSVATSIVDKTEFSRHNKLERDLDGNMVKERCWKLVTDRLGNIIKIIR